MKTWHAKGLGGRTIAQRLDRSTDTVSKHVFQKHARGQKKTVGRPEAITDKRYAGIMSAYETMVSKTNNFAEVTARALKQRLRLKCSFKSLFWAPWLGGASKSSRRVAAISLRARESL